MAIQYRRINPGSDHTTTHHEQQAAFEVNRCSLENKFGWGIRDQICP